MLPGTCIGAGAGAGSGGGPTLSWLGRAASAGNSNVYTFSSQPLGDAAGDRYIIVAVHAEDGSTIVNLPQIDVGSFGTATNLVASPAAGRRTTLAIIAAPTGTTADIEVTNGQVVNNCGIGIWRVVGLNSTTPVDTDSVVETDPASTTVTTINGGFVISAISLYSTTPNGAGWSWTNVTEDYKRFLEGYSYGSGASLSPATGASVTPTATLASETRTVNMATISMF
jgi:hypothetical protein